MKKFIIKTPLTNNFPLKEVDELPKELSKNEIVIEEYDPRDEIVMELWRREKTTGFKPIYLLLGWRVWLQLQQTLSTKESRLPDSRISVTGFNGATIIVDDYEPDVIKALPNATWSQIKIGGYK